MGGLIDLAAEVNAALGGSGAAGPSQAPASPAGGPQNLGRFSALNDEISAALGKTGARIPAVEQGTGGRTRINVYPESTAPAAKPVTQSGVVPNALAGLNEGIASTIGAPVDAATWALNKGIQGANYLIGSDAIPEIQKPFGGSESIKGGMASVGIPTDTVEANTPAERIARGAGYGAGSLVTGAGVASGAREAGLIGGRYLGPMVDSVFGKPDVGTAVMGATSGAGAEAGKEMTNDKYKPVGALFGGLVGGSIPLAAQGAVAAARVGGRMAADAVAPFTEAGRERIAANTIRGAAKDPVALRQALSEAPGEIVPGSQPTTFQKTGDLGLGQLERRLRTENPDAFIAREAQQNVARQAALSGMAGEGSPVAVADYFRSARNALDNEFEATLNAARQRADNAVAALGDGGTAEAHGAIFRGLAQSARDRAKEAERALWKAVDPSGQMVMPAGGIAKAARTIEGELTPSAKPMAGEEKAIFDVARGYGDSASLREVTDLRSRISAEMSQERRAAGFSPVYRRLVQLRGSVEDAIDRAVENQAVLEQRAVSEGRMAAEDTMAARLRGEFKTELGAYEQQSAAPRMGLGGGEGTGGGFSSGASRGFAESGSQGQGQFGFGTTERGSGVQGPVGVPIDENAAARLKAASAATKERASTFDRGPVGDVLRPGAMAGEYRTLGGTVPAKVFHPGPTGAEDARAYIKAVGEQEGIPAIADYAAFSLRKAAVKPDGTFDVGKARTWVARHESALGALPPEVRNKFNDVAGFNEAVATAAANRKAQLAAIDKTAAARMMGLASDTEVTNEIGSILRGKNAVQDMKQLGVLSRGSSAARDGIRRAVVDYIQKEFATMAEAGTSGVGGLKPDAFQKFIRDKAPALEGIFSKEEIGTMQAIARDLQRANRTVSATKLPGGSNTAQDLHGMAHGPHTSIFGRIMAEAAGTGGGMYMAGTPGGVMGWLGAKAAGAMRDAGLMKADNLVREAMLNPDLARALLDRVPVRPDTGTAAKLGLRARQMAFMSAASAGGSDGSE